MQFSAVAAALSVATRPADSSSLRYYTAMFANAGGDAWHLPKSRRIPPNAVIAKLVFSAAKACFGEARRCFTTDRCCRLDELPCLWRCLDKTGVHGGEGDG